MNKQWYRIVLKPLAPLHIGSFKYGVIAETRLFIPGWTIWGALVNKFGKQGNYEHYAKRFKEVTCFYPSIACGEGKREFYDSNSVWFPVLEKGGFFFQRCHSQDQISEEQFRLQFTDTYLSTSIFPETGAAKEESLHEIEVLLPQNKNNPKIHLYFIGLLALDNSECEICEGQLLSVGGETRYGFGNMQVLQVRKLEFDSDDLLTWGIVNGVNSMKILRHYAAISENINHYCSGIREHDIEHVIVEFDFFQNIPKVKKSEVCLVPGSKIENGYDFASIDKGILYI